MLTTVVQLGLVCQVEREIESSEVAITAYRAAFRSLLIYLESTMKLCASKTTRQHSCLGLATAGGPRAESELGQVGRAWQWAPVAVSTTPEK